MELWTCHPGSSHLLLCYQEHSDKISGFMGNTAAEMEAWKAPREEGRAESQYETWRFFGAQGTDEGSEKETVKR